MFFDNPMAEEITATPFRAMVVDGEPYSFAHGAAQDISSSVRLTHLTYSPPTSEEEWNRYYQSHPHLTKPALDGKTTVSVVAKVRTLTQNNKSESFVVACFPLDTSRVPRSDGKSSLVQFGGLFDVLVPVPSDIAGNLQIRLDVDGNVELAVEGPGSVNFFGEQFSALIPEWMNHGMFNVDKDDEEGEEMSGSDLEEMFRLAR